MAKNKISETQFFSTSGLTTPLQFVDSTTDIIFTISNTTSSSYPRVLKPSKTELDEY